MYTVVFVQYYFINTRKEIFVLHNADDENERVRMEAPEIFRVIGKRKPEFVQPYLQKLEYIAMQDCNRVVRIHANGAIKATL